MRKLTTIVIVGGLMLAGCTTETIVREVPTTDPPTTSPARTPEDDFLGFVNGNATSAIYWNDRDLLDLGYLVCGALDEGTSMREVLLILENGAQTQADIDLFAAVMYAGVVNFCPRYLAALESYVASI